MSRARHGPIAAALWCATLGLAWASCTPDSGEVSGEVMEASDMPAGHADNALDNAMHAVHFDRAAPVACGSCHDIGAAEFQPPDREKCLSCHVRNSTAVHREHLPCTDCHEFSVSAKRPPRNCIECHEQAQGNIRALVVHTRRDCSVCHAAHGQPSLAVTDCLECHEDHERRHGSEPARIRCPKCHLPHREAHAALERCGACHDRDKMRSATFRGHSKCDTCHVNQANVRRECLECHARRPGKALAAAKVGKHDKCINCHSPHDPRGTARLSCKRCHDEVHPRHPADGKSGRCLGCHTAHPGSDARIVRPCTTCHVQVATSDTGTHAAQLECKTCHTQHGFAAPRCGTCHPSQARATALAGHDDCRSCHAIAHTPKRSMVACGQCHGVEYNTAPLGHQTCTMCHDKHSGLRSSSAACETCHERQAASFHATVGQGCTTCHRAHGPGGMRQPRACLGCHVQAELPAMHVVREHEACSKCHTLHTPQRVTRDMCLACHTDRADHEPGAIMCIGCHQFRGDR